MTFLRSDIRAKLPCGFGRPAAAGATTVRGREGFPRPDVGDRNVPSPSSRRGDRGHPPLASIFPKLDENTMDSQPSERAGRGLPQRPAKANAFANGVINWRVLLPVPQDWLRRF